MPIKKIIIASLFLLTFLLSPATGETNTQATNIDAIIKTLGSKQTRWIPIEKFIDSIKNDPESVKLLIEKLVLHVHPQKIAGYRNHAVIVLGMTKSKQVIPHLIHTLKNDPAFFVREAAVNALKFFKTPEVTLAITTASHKDKHLYVRRAAKAALLTMKKNIQ